MHQIVTCTFALIAFVGDPEDRTLRKVEIEIMIPMKMRDRAKTEKCSEVVKAFSDCGKLAGLLIVAKCREENKKLKACLTKWYHDEDFKKQCTEEYLDERSAYRRTGIKKKDMGRYVV